MALSLSINGTTAEVEIDKDTPLLWVLRDHLNLTGTKYSCGIGVCGSCTVLMDNEPVQACRVKVGETTSKQITTIEGLSKTHDHPILQAWQELQVPQCGYCQSGQIIMAYALLSRNSNPSDDEIDEAMSPIQCRCGTYPRIREAIAMAARIMSEKEKSHDAI
jgi:aerobic-type carbon monoxide dehydrogenase small subunit (CoxS/CutS family)